MTGVLLVSYVALWFLFLATAVVQISVLRGLGVIYSKLKLVTPQLQAAPSGLKAGHVVPDVTWQTLAGDPRPLRDLRGVRQAIALVSPSCGPCANFLQKVSREAADPLDESVTQRVIVSLGDADSTRQLLAKAGIDGETTVLLDPDRLVTEKWGIVATPVTVIVDEELRVVRQIFGASGGDKQAPAVRSGVPIKPQVTGVEHAI